jgi:hypothetical protein
MNAPLNNSDARREYILAEFRCALAKARLAQLDIEATAVALKHNLITADNAVAMFWESESIQFLGLEIEHESADGIAP